MCFKCCVADMCGASFLDAFLFVTNEVEFGFGRNSLLMVDK